MPDTSPSLIIVIPCYNEEKRLPVEEFRRFDALPGRLHFLLVDDGSTDATAEVIRALAGGEPARYSAHCLPRNRGKAEAVRQGMVMAFERGAQYVGFWDADLATPLDEIPRFLETIEATPSLDMVIGARVSLLGREIRRKRTRHYVGRAFATVASLWLGIGVYDTQCGAKIFRRSSVMERIFSRPFRAKWLFDVEVIARYLQVMHRRGGKHPEEHIAEIPLRRWIDVKGSKVKPADFPKAIGELLGLMLAYKPRG